MDEKRVLKNNNLGEMVEHKIKRIGENVYAESVYIEGYDPSNITVSEYSGSTATAMISSLTSYLSSSARRVLNIQYLAPSLTSYTAIVTELNE